MKLEIIESKDNYASIKIPNNCEVTVKDGFINIEKSIQDGDFVFIETHCYDVIAIFKSHRDDKSIYYYTRIHYLKTYNTIAYDDWCAVKKIRKATEEEKGIFTNALIKDGKYWDASSKSIKIIPEKNKFYFITNKSGTINAIFINKGFGFTSPSVYLNAYALFDVIEKEEGALVDDNVIVCASLLTDSFFSNYTVRKATPSEVKTLLDAMYEKGYEWDFENEKIVKANLFWKPSIGERYYYISSDFTLIGNIYRNSGFDKTLQKNGGCFKTKEAAENCLEEIKKVYKKINAL